MDVNSDKPQVKRLKGRQAFDLATHLLANVDAYVGKTFPWIADRATEAIGFEVTASNVANIANEHEQLANIGKRRPRRSKPERTDEDSTIGELRAEFMEIVNQLAAENQKLRADVAVLEKFNAEHVQRFKQLEHMDNVFRDKITGIWTRINQENGMQRGLPLESEG